jgi:ATP synthase protein I
VNGEARGPDPLAVAMEWVTKITTVGLEMVLPAIGGAFLDKRIGTNYWALIGVVVGMVVGMWHLLQMTRKKDGETGSGKRTRGGSSRE